MAPTNNQPVAGMLHKPIVPLTADSPAAREASIKSLCQAAGCPDKASLFIEADFSVEETHAALLAIVGKRAELDADERYRDEYFENAALHLRNGVSLEDYIRSRRITDGFSSHGWRGRN